MPPEAIPGTPQNKARTEKTVGAIHGIAKTIQDPAGWATVGNRLDYLGEQIGEGNVGAGVDHLFLGKPFPAEVDTGSGGVASDAGAGEAGRPVQLNDWSAAFGDGEGPTERSVPGTVPGLTPEELRSAAQEFDFTQPGLVPPEMPDTDLEGYSTPKFDFTHPGLVPPEMPDTNLEGYSTPKFDFTQPGFVPPEMPIDTTKVASLPVEGAPIAEISTPWGSALQSSDPDALAARSAVEGGASLYRLGTVGKSEAAEAQFWSLEHPLSPGYPARHGIPPENVAKFDFIETATLKPGTPFVTRPAPGIGTNSGGGIEVVVPKNGVNLLYFGGR